MSRVCELTGAKANNGMAVSHSHIRTKKLQQVNLQKRRLWWQEGKKWVNIKISTKALKLSLIHIPSPRDTERSRMPSSA